MLELLILTALGLWLALALRSAFRRKGGCGCTGCSGHCAGCHSAETGGKARPGSAEGHL